MIKVVRDGTEFYCESVDEALELHAKFQGLPHSKASANGAERANALGPSRWTVSRFNTFTGQLRDRQKRFLREILAEPDGVTDETLRKSFGVDNNKGFGPLLTGISRRAKKVGVSLPDVVISEKIPLSGGGQVLEFKAATAFAKIAEESGGIK